MTDDTRQARIAAAEQAIDDAIWRLMGTRMSIRGENLYQQVATAAIDAADAAAPAVGVTVEQAEAMLDRYFTNRFESIMADGQHLAIGFLEQAESEKTHLIALLTAAPAERGDLDALTTEVGAWGERTFPNATDQTIINHLTDEASELGYALAFAQHQWPESKHRDVAEEAADCLLLLMHLAHRNGFSLMDEARKKFAVNQTRTWNTVTTGGYVKHDEVVKP